MPSAVIPVSRKMSPARILAALDGNTDREENFSGMAGPDP